MELAPAHVMTAQALLATLQTVPKVEHVEWQLAKSAQRNCGEPYMEQNNLVSVPGYANTPIEFLLTRNQHMKRGANCPFSP